MANFPYTISVAINRYKLSVERVNSDSWEVNSSVDISWDSESIGGLNDQVLIELARYQIGEDDVVLHSFRKALETSNTGRSQFVITTGQEDG